MYVQRDAQLKITGAYVALQPGYAEELVADTDPALLAFLNPPPDARLVAIDDNIKTTTIGTVTPKSVAELKAMDLATYSAWFDANFGTAALLINLLKRLTLVIVRRVL